MADYSLYPQAPEPVNPLTTAGSAMGLVGQMNQNQLFQQQFGARQAIGRAYANSIDPQTGELDTNKLLGNVAGDPRAAFMAGDVAQAALARRQAQLDIRTKEIDNATKQTNWTLGKMKTLAVDPQFMDDPDYAQRKMNEVLAEAMDPSGIGMSAQQAALHGLDFKEYAAQGPQGVQTYLNRVIGQGMSHAEFLAAQKGQLTMQDQGGQTLPLAYSQFNGLQQVGPAIPKTPTVGERMQRTPVFANGQMGSVPTLSMTPNVPRGTNPLMGQSGGGNPLLPSGFVPNAPALGTEAAANEQAKHAAEQGNSLGDLANQVPDRKAVLNNMLGALQSFSSGPGADSWRTVKAAGLRLGINLGDAKDSTAGQEEFAKFAKQLAIQQSGALGAGTDEKLETAMGASPNTDLSKLGNQKIMHVLLGNEDAISAKNMAWQAYAKDHGAQSYQWFSTQFNQNFDPRIYQWKYLSPEERKAEFNKLGSQDQAIFNQKKDWLKNAGLLNVR